jgi:hypothetical protein
VVEDVLLKALRGGLRRSAGAKACENYRRSALRFDQNRDDEEGEDLKKG